MSYDVHTFAGVVGPAAYFQTSTFSSTAEVAPGAVSLDVMADWATAYADDIDFTVYDPSGANRGSTWLLCGAPQPNGYSSFCSSAPNERLTFPSPMPGTWRVDVGGFVNSTENVRGAWSVAYPDGTLMPPAQQAASITLAASLTSSAQGQSVGVTATVADATGRPVPNAGLSWTSTGAGWVGNAETLTGADGLAVATALSDAPGTQTVTVRTGTLSASVALTWVGGTPCVGCPPEPSSPGKASGSGRIAVGAVKRTFAFSGRLYAGATAPGGALRFDDKAGTAVSSDTVDIFRVSGTTATLKGPATVNGVAGYRYELTVTDNGAGSNDTFRLSVTQPGSLTYSYTSSGTLSNGNIRVAAG